jgi:DUF4097 and DUF4098 domain-containing protein YvlB
MNMSRAILVFTTVWLSSVYAYAGEQVSQSLAVDADSRISIANLRGKVNIIGWDKPEVQVEGELDELTEEFIFEKRDGKVVIKVEVPEKQSTYNNNSEGSKLTIQLPSKSLVSFQGVSSDVTVKNLLTSTEVKTVSGDIAATNLANRIEFNTVSGNIDSKDMSGKINLNTVSGDIDDQGSTGRLDYQTVSGELSVKAQAKEVVIRTVSGDLDAEILQVEDLKMTTVSGDLEAKVELANNAYVKASSVSGSVQLKLPEDTSADFKLRSNAGGRITNKLTNDQVIKAKYGPSSKLNFALGSAQSSVQVSTVSGNIKLMHD